MNGIEGARKHLILQVLVSCLLSLGVIVLMYFVLTAPEPGVASGSQVFALLGLGLGVVLVSWGLMLRRGFRLLELRPQTVPAARPGSRDDAKAVAAPKEPPPPQQTSALQMLALLQRQGRLLDFLQEDLATYDDAQVGAAVRSIHAGCKEAVAEVVKIAPVLSEEEGASVNVPQGFDPRSIRLIGNVKGKPPFQGTLRHRGWQVTQLEAPRVEADSKAERVLAPAEVEIGG